MTFDIYLFLTWNYSIILCHALNVCSFENISVHIIVRQSMEHRYCCRCSNVSTRFGQNAERNVKGWPQVRSDWSQIKLDFQGAKMYWNLIWKKFGTKLMQFGDFPSTCTALKTDLKNFQIYLIWHQSLLNLRPNLPSLVHVVLA